MNDNTAALAHIPMCAKEKKRDLLFLRYPFGTDTYA